jgi:hypothetical protein
VNGFVVVSAIPDDEVAPDGDHEIASPEDSHFKRGTYVHFPGLQRIALTRNSCRSGFGTNRQIRDKRDWLSRLIRIK